MGAAVRDIDMKSLLDIPEWEKIQDELAKLTGTAIITVDYKGTPVTKHSERTDFCTVIRENPVSRKRCYKCDALAGLEAVRLNRPYIYLCYCGIVDVAVPVVVGERYLGAVMFGQVRIPNDDTDAKVERLVSEISSFHAEEESARQDLLEMYNRLPEMEYKRIVEIANMLNSVVHYVINRSLKLRNEQMEYEYMVRNSMPPTLDGDGAKAEADLRELEMMTEPPKNIPDSSVQNRVPMSSAVYPAVSYIEDHISETPTMKEMADLCHLSHSYFSRLFLKEVGENYVDYLNRRKVETAMQKLRTTSETVTNIAFGLGFQDGSYFIKVFRKLSGTTPTEYRRRNYVR